VTLSLVLVVIGSLLLPLPGWLIDGLIVASNLYAFWLVVSVISANSTGELTNLPNNLLLSTVLRLSLNVATTRCILSGSDSGQLIGIVGHTVLQDGLLTGIVVFGVISIILMLVITKGAERVAEVAARFALDGLPGRQMTIDADVRSGLISFEMAQRRREALQTESKLCGALDGCMKFIKGDALVGIIIMLANLLGGILIAYLDGESSLTDAVHKFSSLTIGDGLASQIPSFLNALAAGYILTKVEKISAEDGASDSTVVRFSRYLKVAGLLIFSVGMIPGGPHLLLLSLGTLVLIVGIMAARTAKISASEVQVPQKLPTFFQPPRVQILISPASVLSEAELRSVVMETLHEFQRRSGLLINMAVTCVRSAGLENESARLELHIRDLRVDSCEVKYRTAEENQICLALLGLFQRSLKHLLNENYIRELLDQLANTGLESASQIRSQGNHSELVPIFLMLLESKIPLHDWDILLNTFIEEHSQPSVRRRVETIRKKLALRICSICADSHGTVKAYIIEQQLDAEISESELNSRVLEDTRIKILLEKFSELPKDEIVVCSSMTGTLLRDYLLFKRLEISLISYEEIVAPFRLHVLGVIDESRGEALEYQSALLC
jgi:flagellar biosynthesis component FlhA